MWNWPGLGVRSTRGLLFASQSTGSRQFIGELGERRLVGSPSGSGAAATAAPASASRAWRHASGRHLPPPAAPTVHFPHLRPVLERGFTVRPCGFVSGSALVPTARPGTLRALSTFAE